MEREALSHGLLAYVIRTIPLVKDVPTAAVYSKSPLSWQMVIEQGLTESLDPLPIERYLQKRPL